MIKKQLQITTLSLEETQLLGQKTGELINGGTVIALTGDLGSGKTSFIQGLAKGLGVPNEYYVTSPSYTLINEYPGRCPLFHADLYRLEHVEDIEEIGLYEILDSEEGVVAIEWADKFREILPDHIAIHLEIADDESRKISISADSPENITLTERISDIYNQQIEKISRSKGVQK
ncbi:tRNA (adenosine(37)-N6)-threonylcarbamoyltransferase complex ATPase subunit type 1 TsaE [Desulfonema magnum]|uniref:tRNA threonylcarbamoyladenosine biosynthesis protein TsaE n=1 Tax=Desulfonema magnum TaxID=45655 RepID=A0A975GPZ4_9BACT|nr:tRNA (adenosine(37)-N6)-threonylcarbamoyltransferase complex ATPase subunit type 1 TsaE [Desulfonema magnum]QTA89352.1 tRNA threonylcarbamoyl adenosine modification protein [Desulfonema magnum]